MVTKYATLLTLGYNLIWQKNNKWKQLIRTYYFCIIEVFMHSLKTLVWMNTWHWSWVHICAYQIWSQSFYQWSLQFYHFLQYLQTLFLAMNKCLLSVYRILTIGCVCVAMKQMYDLIKNPDAIPASIRWLFKQRLIGLYGAHWLRKQYN